MTRWQVQYERGQLKRAIVRTQAQEDAEKRAEDRRMADIERIRERELIYGFKAAHEDK